MIRNSFQNIPIPPKKIVKKNNTKILIIVAIVLVIFCLTLLLYLNRNQLFGTANTDNSNLGQPNTLVQQYKDQLPALAKKVQESGTNKQARRDYAVALYATGDIEQAKNQYLEELKLNPNDAVIFNNLGNIYRDLGKYDDAVTNYKKSIELNKQIMNAYINLANVYIYSLNKPDLGIETYKNALLANPNNSDLNLSLANAYEQMGKKDNAKVIFESILAKEPGNQAAQQGLIRLSIIKN
jgi:tetratricopeptide (TPR) repeat protein